MRAILILALLCAPLWSYETAIPVRSLLATGTPSTVGAPGRPALPQIVVPLVLPAGSNLDTVTLELRSPVVEDGGTALGPLNGPIRILNRPRAVPAVEPLDPARPFPEAWARIGSVGRMGDIPIVQLIVNPVRLENGRLRRLTDGTLHLRVGGTPVRALTPQSRSARAMAAKAWNAAEAAAWFAWKTDADSLLVVVPRALRAGSRQLGPYIQAMKDNGWAVECVEIETIAGAAFGQERADLLRAYLQGRAAGGVTHVLLIGSPHPTTGDLPMKQVHPLPDELTHAVPTDLYYADLSGNWDKNGDGLAGTYGKDGGAGGVDFLPEVIVGRIPASYNQVEQLDGYLRRLMTFKSTPQDPARRVLLPESIPFLPNENYLGEPMTDGAELGEEFSEFVLQPLGIPHIKLYEKEGRAVSPHACDFPLTEEKVLDLWKEGAGAVLWYGHGAPDLVVRTVWMTDDGNRRPEWDKGEVDQPVFLRSAAAWDINPRSAAFFFAVACSNAYPYEEDNLTAALFRTGAIAASGASEWAAVYGAETGFKDHGSATGIGYRFMENLIAGGMDAGTAMHMANGDPLTDWGDPYWWANRFDYNLYGDPTVVYAGGQWATPVPEPEIYWATVGSAAAGGCPQDLELLVRGAGEGLTLSVPGAPVLGAEVEAMTDLGGGLYSAVLSGARVLAGRQALPVALGATEAAPVVTGLLPTLYDPEGNYDGAAERGFADILRASTRMEGDDFVFEMDLARDLPSTSTYTGEDFFIGVWWLDTDGDRAIDMSLRYQVYQRQAYAVLVSEPDFEFQELVASEAGPRFIRATVPASLLSVTGAAMFWQPSVYDYTKRYGYTYQDVTRWSAQCVQGGALRVGVLPGGTGGLHGAVNPAPQTAWFGAVDPVSGGGRWEALEARTDCAWEAEPSASFWAAGTAPGATGFAAGTDPFAFQAPNTALWAAGDAACLDLGGGVEVVSMDSGDAVLKAGGRTVVVPPNGSVSVPLDASACLSVKEGQNVAVFLSTDDGAFPLRPADRGFTAAWFPGAAHIAGAWDSSWASRLTLLNPNAGDAAVDIVLHRGGWTAATHAMAMVIPAGASRTLEDIVVAVGGAPGFGTLEVTASAPLQGWLWTYNEGDPAQGQMIPPLASEEALVAGEVVGVPEALKGDLTKVLLTNPGPGWAEVAVGQTLLGFAPGMNLIQPVGDGEAVGIVRGRALVTLSARQQSGQAAALHITASETP